MPVFYSNRNVDAVTGFHLHSFLAPLLIIASAADTDQNLAAAFICVMDMPIVPASRLKGHIKNPHLLFGYRCNVALAGKIPGETVIGRTDWKQNGILVFILLCQLRL